MKALVLKEYNHFSYESVPEPKAEADDVVIEVKACGICGSDVHGMDGSTGRRVPPIIMGHEASGIIAEVGKNVKDFSKGDRVTFDSTIYCGRCYYCLRGFINLCNNRRVMGVSCDEYHHDGAFAEYVSLPRRILYRLPDGVSFEQAAVVEPLSIAFHSVNRMPVSLSDTAVVVGSGMIGLLVIQLLKASGCRKIIAVDIEQNKLDLALKLGADVGLRTDIINIPEEIYKLTGNRGADVAYEAVGITPTIKIAVESLRKGGSLSLVGNISSMVELPLQITVSRQITIFGSCASCLQYPNCLELIESKSVNIDALISKVVPLSEGALWFKRLQNRQPGLLKVILLP